MTIHEEYIAACRRHARMYARRATEGIRDKKGEPFITANAVIANLYYAAALDAAHFGDIPEAAFGQEEADADKDPEI